MTETVNDQTLKADLCDHYHNVSFFLFNTHVSFSSKCAVFFQPVVTAFSSYNSGVSQLLKEISSIVTDPKAPFRLYRQRPSLADAELEEFQILLPTLEAWAQQLHLLKVKQTKKEELTHMGSYNGTFSFTGCVWQDLQRGLNKLSVRLMPCLTTDDGHIPAEAVKVEDMMLLLDSMLENTAPDDEKVELCIILRYSRNIFIVVFVQ